MNLQARDLEPCPFCGGEAEIRFDLPGAVGAEMASCKQCGTQAFWKKWNTRALGTPPDVGEGADLEQKAVQYFGNFYRTRDIVQWTAKHLSTPPQSIRGEALEEAAKVAETATLPDGYLWGHDAMEQFDFGKERAATAIRNLKEPTK